MPRPAKVGIKVISTSLGFAAVERQTIERKTLKILVKFGEAAPRPWRKHQNFNPRDRCPGHSSNRNCKQKFSSCYRFPNLVRPVFALIFWQNFVKKIPRPSPSPGAHNVWNLSRNPHALAPKKKFGAPGPPTGEIWGVKVSNSPPSPSNSLRQISECRRPGAWLVPGYNARDFGTSAGNVAADISDFILAPGPKV